MEQKFAAVWAANGTEFDDIIGFREKIEVVFDDDDGVALIDERMEYADEAFAVAKMEADGRFLQEVKVAWAFAARAFAVAGEPAGKFGDEFEALGFTAGERGRGLAEREVAKAAIDHELADLRELRVEVEERRGFLEGELKNLADGFTLPRDVGEVRAVAEAAAVVAGQVGVGHERHLEFDAASPFAGGTAATGGIKGKTRCGVAADFSFRQRGEKLPDQVEDTEIRRGRGTRGFANRRLVDLDHRAEDVGASEGFEWCGCALGAEARGGGKIAAREFGFFSRDRVRDGRVEDVAEKCRFTGATWPGDHDETAEREAQVEAF